MGDAPGKLASAIEAHLAAIFPEDMGNRGRNVLSVRDTALRLAELSLPIRFVGYHWRLSGNFVFEWNDPVDMRKAEKLGQQVTQLRCLARRFQDLRALETAVPEQAQVIRNSVLIKAESSTWRVIFVALSEPLAARVRASGELTPRVAVLSWPSERDALCVYERSGESGDIGQVTRAVVRAVKRSGAPATLFGTGRAMGVVQDLLAWRGVNRI
jgi:hypothetical protein